MAAEDYVDFSDMFDDWFESDAEPRAFETKCEWCSGLITMTPQPNGKWRPMVRGKVHFCEARRKAQIAADIAAMPDMTLPECQFCNTPMVYRKFGTDPDVTWESYTFRLYCDGCGSTGPEVPRNSPKFRELVGQFS